MTVVRAYCFDFINHDGSIDSYDIGAFASDLEAEHRARTAMLVSTTAVLVEVWSQGSRVARIPRGARVRRPLRAVS